MAFEVAALKQDRALIGLALAGDSPILRWYNFDMLAWYSQLTQ